MQNTGTGVAQPTGWIDTVYLTNDPTNPLDKNAITMTLGSVEHDTVLNPSATYNASLNVELSPSAVGQYFVVYTDAPQPNDDPNFNIVQGDRRDQQPDGRSPPIVTPGAGRPGRDQRLDPAGELLGRADDVHLHRDERRARTRCGRARNYWTDFIWLSADPTFDRDRASFLGQTTHVQDQPLQPGAELQRSRSRSPCPPAPAASTTSTSTSTPTTTCRLTLTSTRRGWRRPTGGRQTPATTRTGWASSTTGRSRTRTTTGIATPFDITYREPDLKVTNITVPPNVTSGETIPITYTVTNQGTRATRTR